MLIFDKMHCHHTCNFSILQSCNMVNGILGIFDIKFARERKRERDRERKFRIKIISLQIHGTDLLNEND